MEPHSHVKNNKTNDFVLDTLFIHVLGCAKKEISESALHASEGPLSSTTHALVSFFSSPKHKDQIQSNTPEPIENGENPEEISNVHVAGSPIRHFGFGLSLPGVSIGSMSEGFRNFSKGLNSRAGFSKKEVHGDDTETQTEKK